MQKNLDYEAILRELREADALYQGISSFSIWNSTSLDFELWARYADLLTRQREQSMDEAIAQATTIALRSAAIDTGAIEGLYETDRGFTFAVAYQQAGWEVAAEEKGEQVRALFEAQLQAYEMVLDAATGQKPISESWIRQLHELICRPQQTYKVLTPQGWREAPLPKGSYKQAANHVVQPDGVTHSYAPVSETPHEMAKLVETLREPEFLEAHAARQAAFAHHALTRIHPFADGNGRVARAIASLFFYRQESIPFVVYADTRDEYLTALREADTDQINVFIEFVVDRGVDTLGDVRRNLKLARSGSLEGSVDTVRALLTGHGGLTHKELDAVAARILSGLLAEVNGKIQSLGLPADVRQRVAMEHRGGVGGVPSGFRPEWTDQQTMVLRIFSPPPASANVDVSVRCFISTDEQARFPFLLRAPEVDEDLPIRLGEVFPNEKPSFKNRLATWADLLVTEALVALSKNAEEALRNAGYKDRNP